MNCNLNIARVSWTLVNDCSYLSLSHRLQEVELLREERNRVAGRMKAKMELSERQILIEKG